MFLNYTQSVFNFEHDLMYTVGKLYHSFLSQCKLEDTNLKTMNILETEKRLTRPQSSSCNDEVVSEDSCPLHFRMVEA